MAMMGCFDWATAGGLTDVVPGRILHPADQAHAANARELPQRRAFDGEVAF
jgi:hypothetical protein